MSATGTWNAEVDSPMGKTTIVIELVEADGQLTGTATSDGDTVEITKGNASGNELTWSLVVSRPMKMTLAFKVELDGDTFAGTAKPNVFPASKVNATRAVS
jgi:hypothetical protein